MEFLKLSLSLSLKKDQEKSCQTLPNRRNPEVDMSEGDCLQWRLPRPKGRGPWALGRGGWFRFPNRGWEGKPRNLGRRRVLQRRRSPRFSSSCSRQRPAPRTGPLSRATRPRPTPQALASRRANRLRLQLGTPGRRSRPRPVRQTNRRPVRRPLRSRLRPTTRLHQTKLLPRARLRQARRLRPLRSRLRSPRLRLSPHRSRLS